MQKPTVIIIFDSAAGADPAIRGYFIGEHGAARANYAFEVLRRGSPWCGGRGTEGPTFYASASELTAVLDVLGVCQEHPEVVRPNAGGPTAPWFSPQQIRTLHAKLGTSGGYLEIAQKIDELKKLIEKKDTELAGWANINAVFHELGSLAGAPDVLTNMQMLSRVRDVLIEYRNMLHQVDLLSDEMKLTLGAAPVSIVSEARDRIRGLGATLEQTKRWLADRDEKLSVLGYPLELLRGVVGASLTEDAGVMLRRAAGLLAEYKLVIDQAKSAHETNKLEGADSPALVIGALSARLQVVEPEMRDLHRAVGFSQYASPGQVLTRAAAMVRSYAEVAKRAEVLRHDYAIVAKTPLEVLNAMVGVIDELEAAVKKASVVPQAYSQHVAAMVNPKLRANARKLAEEVNHVIKALKGKRTHENLDDDTFEPGLLSATVLAWERRMRGAVDTALISTQIDGHHAVALAALAIPPES